MNEMTIDVMRGLLRNNVVEVIFEKADGTLRRMFATTNPLYIKDYDPLAVSTTTPSAEVLKVVDTELNGAWRSFRFDSIQEFTVTNMPVLEQTEEGLVA